MTLPAPVLEAMARAATWEHYKGRGMSEAYFEADWQIRHYREGCIKSAQAAYSALLAAMPTWKALSEACVAHLDALIFLSDTMVDEPNKTGECVEVVETRRGKTLEAALAHASALRGFDGDKAVWLPKSQCERGRDEPLGSDAEG